MGGRPVRAWLRAALSGMMPRVCEALRGVLLRQRADAELDEEVRFHLDMEAQRLVADEGLAPAEARRRAALLFGGVEKHKEDVRAARGLAWLTGMALDFRLGGRMMRRYWGLTLVAGLGMALAMALGAVLHAAAHVVDVPLPVPEGARVVAIEVWDASASNQERRILHDFARWREELQSIRDVGLYRSVGRNLVTGDAEVEPVVVAEMSASGFGTVRVPPLLGRTLLVDDERAGAHHVVVIGYDAWQSRFAGDPHIVGRDIRLGGTVHTVVGVMPDGFAFPLFHRYWVPMRRDVAAAMPREGPAVHVFGRLADGATMAGARAELVAIGERMAATQPETHAQLRPRVLPYTTQLFDDMTGWELPIAYTVVVLLLLVICANIAILMYSRTVSRLGEIAVRSALGASRRRIVGQLFVEALVLALAAGLLGLVGAHLVVQHVNGLLESWGNAEAGGLPYWLELRITPATVLLVFGLAAIAAAVTGAVPALRVAGGRVQSDLRQLGGATGLQLGRTWNGLITAQVAVAVALLPAAMSAGWKSLLHANANPGFAAEEYLGGLLALDPDDGAGEVSAAARFVAAQAELAARLLAEPRVAGVTFALDLPGLEPTVRVEVESIPTGIAVRHAVVDPAFFETFDVPVGPGRGLNDGDAAGEATQVVVNQSFARQVGVGNVVGRRIQYVAGYRSGGVMRTPAGVDMQRWYEIAGVVPDFPAPIDPDEVTARVYHALAPGSTARVGLIVRAAGAATGELPLLVRRIAAAVDPALQVRSVRTLDETLRETQGGIRLAALAVGLIMLSVLLLSAAGIYALVSFTVARRRREIGIRVALGAGHRHILTRIFTRSVAQLGAGVAAGLLLAALLEMLTGGATLDGRGLVLLPLVAGLMVAVGLLAAAAPAWRAVGIPPTEALQQE
jgi:putative ABC transport system permease protein